PRFDFESNYEEDFSGLHLYYLRQAALVLEMAPIEQLREGDTAGAVTNIHTLLAIVNACQDELILTSQMFRIGLAQMALASQWELLQTTNVADAQLASLQHDWTVLEFARSLENTFLMERAMT